MLIGETKIDAINWVQEALDYARRDVAEETLSLLIEKGLAKVLDEGVFLIEELPEEELRKKSREAMRIKDGRVRMMSRRSVPTRPNMSKAAPNVKNARTRLKVRSSDSSNIVGEDDPQPSSEDKKHPGRPSKHR